MLALTALSDIPPADDLALVRRAWAAWTSGDLERFFALMHADAELIPVFGGGRTLRGRAAAETYLREMHERSRHIETQVHAFEERASSVLVSASVRLHEGHGFRDATAYYVFSVRDGLIARVVGVAGREEAVALAERAGSEPD